MKQIEVKNGLYALVDDEDYAAIQKRWHLDSGGYVTRLTSRNDLNKNGRRKVVFLHRVIMNARNGEMVDHINHNKLDNRKENLRIVNKSQNAINSKVRTDNKSGHRGVYFEKRSGKWVSEIRVGGKKYWLGRYANKLAASREYKIKALELHGEYVYAR